MAGDQSHELRKDSVGTLEVAALSFAGPAPTMAMALGTSFAAIQAGAAVSLAYLLGMIGSLALAYVSKHLQRGAVVSSNNSNESLVRAATAPSKGTASSLKLASASTRVATS